MEGGGRTLAIAIVTAFLMAIPLVRGVPTPTACSPEWVATASPTDNGRQMTATVEGSAPRTQITVIVTQTEGTNPYGIRVSYPNGTVLTVEYFWSHPSDHEAFAYTTFAYAWPGFTKVTLFNNDQRPTLLDFQAVGCPFAK